MPTGIFKRKPLTKEHKENIRKSLKGNTHGFKKGHHPANEFKKGHITSIAIRKKISIALKGYHPVTEFKKGHTHGVKKGQTGKNSLRWKDGRTINRGYILIYKPNHPFACGNYVREHRLIIEQQIGRYLKPRETCHHLNEIKNDNRPENLMAFISKSVHLRFHKNPANVKSNEIIFDGRKLIKGE